ncbi:MAG TPA: tetratricopeptide repeat protein [Methanomassiliicoccales archaeon]|jgi:pentatricopeptide repeat protein
MPSPVTIGERIILHLAQYSKFKDDFDAPVDVSQDGIAEALRISRAHAAIELKKLKESALVDERIAHIRRGSTKRKVYYLNKPGEDKANSLRAYADREGIQIKPLLDLKKCQGPELWESLDPSFRPLLAQACVFRAPFKRSALPTITISLLPEDKSGMVDIPEALRNSIPGLASRPELRQYHSFAADYWLKEGNNRERLYHLVHSGRVKEAEMMVASKGPELLANPDKDLYDLLSAITAPAERYASRVYFAQGEAARGSLQFDKALASADRLMSMTNEADRRVGMCLKARTLMDRGDLEESIASYLSARSIAPLTDTQLECDYAEALTRLRRFEEARQCLEKMMASGLKGMDPESLELVYYQLGSVLFRSGNGHEAIRYLSKALGLARPGDKSRIYRCMSEAYLSIGMEEKSVEYGKKARLK